MTSTSRRRSPAWRRAPSEHERRRRDATALLAASPTELLASPEDAPDAGAIEAVVSRVTLGLADDDDPSWLLADRIARLHDADPDAMRLAIDWLDALIRHRDTT